MKTLVLIFLLTSGIGIYNGFAQRCVIDYNYDASGNRIERLQACDYDMHGPHIPASITDLTDSSKNLTESLFPNPTAGPVSIIFNNPVSEAHVTIVDNVGRQLLSTTVSGTSVPLDLSNFAQGVYFITVKSGSNTFINSIVKN